MKYFKNTELAKLYNVSEKSVRNWIEATRQGKLSLQLHEESGKWFVANTSKNTLLLEPLVEKGKKYRNGRGFKTISPTADFYNLYSTKQVLDIIANMDIHREIPYQYNYFDGGAEHWDRYSQRLVDEKIPSTLTSTIQQADDSMRYIDDYLSEYDYVNIIDVGAGNCLPIKNLVEHLLDRKKIKRYIAIDASQDMLRIAERKFTSWFGEKVQFEGYIRDINYERFDDLIGAESFSTTGKRTANIIILFGDTIYNLRDTGQALKTINESMEKTDILIINSKLDSKKSRRYFDFASNSEKSTPDFRGKFMLDLLNIDGSLYSLEQFFDEQNMMRLARVRIEIALSLEFEMNGAKRVVDLNKGDRLLLWRVWHQNAVEKIEQLSEHNFDLLLASRSKDQEYLLTISKIGLNR
jgi:uncharacterized SAM-dependent methyltransferase